MILSVVTGTYNRLEYLRDMMMTVRQNVPPGFTYEFVIVDGGSTDGTIAWLQSQGDVHLILHGELKGAIPAFCDGAKAAQGQYVLLANDDVIFEDGAIVPAIVHLETVPTCGAVAFADDRPVKGYPKGFKVQTMQIHNNGVKAYPYAQVGLFRGWLGDLVGWWGADDPAFEGHTYGGDNYLSARIYEYGYTIDEVAGCHVHDRIPADDLRSRNHDIELSKESAYYRRFPQPPRFRSQTTNEGDNDFEAMRFLYWNLYEPGFGHYKRGLRDAFARVGLVWECDYLAGGVNLVDQVRQFQPHILLTQFHSPNDLDVNILAAARRANPGMLVVNWNGDVYEQNLTSPEMLAFLRHFDLQLTVNADVLDVYAVNGIPAEYWQVAFEPVDYDHLPDAATHDIVFLANAYTEERLALGESLRTMKRNIGLYGHGWSYADGLTTYDFAKGAAIYSKSKIAIGDNQYHRAGFVSNRMFEALASGIFLMHEIVPGLEDWTGLIDGVHYVSWESLDDLVGKAEYYLRDSNEMKRQQIADEGQAFVRTEHSFDARVQELLTVIIPGLNRERV